MAVVIYLIMGVFFCIGSGCISVKSNPGNSINIHNELVVMGKNVSEFIDKVEYVFEVLSTPEIVWKCTGHPSLYNYCANLGGNMGGYSDGGTHYYYKFDSGWTGERNQANQAWTGKTGRYQVTIFLNTKFRDYHIGCSNSANVEWISGWQTINFKINEVLKFALTETCYGSTGTHCPECEIYFNTIFEVDIANGDMVRMSTQTSKWTASNPQDRWILDAGFSGWQGTEYVPTIKFRRIE